MNVLFKPLRVLALTLAFSGSVLLTACSDDDSGPTDDDGELRAKVESACERSERRACAEGVIGDFDLSEIERAAALSCGDHDSLSLSLSVGVHEAKRAIRARCE